MRQSLGGESPLQYFNRTSFFYTNEQCCGSSEFSTDPDLFILTRIRIRSILLGMLTYFLYLWNLATTERIRIGGPLFTGIRSQPLGPDSGIWYGSGRKIRGKSGANSYIITPKLILIHIIFMWRFCNFQVSIEELGEKIEGFEDYRPVGGHCGHEQDLGFPFIPSQPTSAIRRSPVTTWSPQAIASHHLITW